MSDAADEIVTRAKRTIEGLYGSIEPEAMYRYLALQLAVAAENVSIGLVRGGRPSSRPTKTPHHAVDEPGSPSEPLGGVAGAPGIPSGPRNSDGGFSGRKDREPATDPRRDPPKP